MNRLLAISLAICSFSVVSVERLTYEEAQIKINKCEEVALIASSMLAAATVDNIPKEEMETKLSRFEASSEKERKAVNFIKIVMAHAYRTAKLGSTSGFTEFYYDTCLNNFDKFKNL
ncbi:hypothetical protein ACRN9Z_19180 [Shewanella frigidimarina]|uniref:hypothetical protein n=1 Tax=Shewanella TaxID=22 RepID=UPI001600580D|nr:hypothetical protein [Shewanella sp. SR44-4]MBB1364540.1 hypothetical protein [Shewanella sp. SR44-4]